MACLVHVIKSDSHVESALKQGFVTLQCGHTIPLLSAACSASKGTLMHVSKGFVGSKSVNVLRDTGCSGIVVRSALVHENQRTRRTKICILIDGTVRRFPIAKVFIKTQYYTGLVEAMCMTNPVYDLVVGNIPDVKDLGENRSSVTCIQTKYDKSAQTEIECKSSVDLYPSSSPSIELGNAVETRNQVREKPLKSLNVSEPVGGAEITVEKVRIAQQEDP